MPIGRTNNFPESGRGLGHVTPTIFGSTVGYPSDSLASCLITCATARRDTPAFHLTLNSLVVSYWTHMGFYISCFAFIERVCMSNLSVNITQFE